MSGRGSGQTWKQGGRGAGSLPSVSVLICLFLINRGVPCAQLCTLNSFPNVSLCVFVCLCATVLFLYFSFILCFSTLECARLRKYYSMHKQSIYIFGIYIYSLVNIPIPFIFMILVGTAFMYALLHTRTSGLCLPPPRRVLH